MVYPVTIQKQNEETEAWSDFQLVHALKVNHTMSGETTNAGAEQYHHRLTFEFRWRPYMEDVAHTPQIYRLVYRGRLYNIIDYDDYMENHRKIHLVGVAYGA